MPDTRFFEDLGPVSLGELARIGGAEPPAAAIADMPIGVVAPLDRAGAGALSFYSDRRYLADLAATAASACFVTAANADKVPGTCFALVTGEPQAAYARAANRLYRPRSHGAQTQAVHPTAVLEDDVAIAFGAVIGADARVGRGSVIGPNAVVGPGVTIGRHCVIGANAVISFALLGDNVRIAAGAVIGEAGFGVTGSSAGALDIPQLGRVILQDGVSIGANTSVDRGAYDDTVIGENTKIDNQVQIGHNVRLGRSCVLAGHVGISGTVIVGDGVRFGGRAGIADHVNIGDGAQVMAAAGVMRDIPAGETWGGAPAMPGRQWMRQIAWLTRNSAGKRDQ